MSKPDRKLGDALRALETQEATPPGYAEEMTAKVRVARTIRDIAHLEIGAPVWALRSLSKRESPAPTPEMKE